MELRGFRGNVRPAQLQAQRSHEDQVRHAILCREPHWFRRVGWEVHQLNFSRSLPLSISISLQKERWT